VSQLEVSVAAGDTGPVITLSGEADFQGTADLSTILAAQLSGGAVHMLVDASELVFADSTVVRALVITGRTLRERGGALVLVRAQPAVARVLELMGADHFIQLQRSAGA
jgi:anti-sigma B factor antagonist